MTINTRNFVNRVGQFVFGGTSGSILYVDASGNMAQDNTKLFWDATNKRLGIGTTSPVSSLQISANALGMYQAATTGTSSAYSEWSNTSNQVLFGVDSNAGGNILSGSSANSCVLGSAGNFPVQIGTNNTIRLSIDGSGVMQYFQNTTGGGSAALGANCPAVTVNAPYTWFTIKSSDGSTVYIPAWK